MEKVKCQECGYLTLFNEGSNHFVESPRHYRKKGEKSGAIHLCGGGPCCFVDAEPISDEYSKCTLTEPKRTLTIIEKERPCTEWVRWLQGIDPKGHLQMKFNADTLAQQAKHFETITNMQIEARKNMEDTRRAWEESERLKDRQSKFWRGLMATFITTVWGIVLPIIVYQYFKIPKP